MSLKVKEEETGQPTPTLNAMGPQGLSPELIEGIRREMKTASSEAVDRAFSYADAVSRDLIARVREELQGYAKPKAQVLAVEVDGEKRKLSRAAPEFLGRMIINAKRGIATILIGPAGCGKTISAELLAEALKLPFGQICLSAGASETWLFGRQTPNGFVEAEFSRMYREGGVFLLDELDAADANMLLSINTAVANGHLYNPISGTGFKRHADFVIVATANTACLGGDMIYTGRNRLDGASLTRFVKIAVDYNQALETELCPDQELREAVWGARTKLKELRAPQILSTRCLEYAYAQISEGISKADVYSSLTMGWPEEIVMQTGMRPGSGKAVAVKKK